MSLYGPIAAPTYSLARFLREFREKKLPPTVHLGGEIAFDCRESLRGGQFILLGQGQVLHFRLSLALPVLQTVGSGDKVIVTFDAKDLNDQGEVTSIKALNVVVPLKREPVYLQSAPALLEKWSEFIDKVRAYFKNRGLLEVLTPSLVQNPGMEVELEPFAVELKVGSRRAQLFLPTSPELHLKQMIVNGFTDIFEIKTVFRNGEITELHEPEFQMLEWYRAYADLSMIREDLIGLVREVAGQKLEVRVSSMRELFAKHLGFNLTPKTTREDLMLLCRGVGVEFVSDDDWNELFHRVFVEKVEPLVGQEIPEIVYDFPPSMAALARLTPEGFADRFELFWKGMEIANAFHELNDPVEQRVRFEREIEERRSKGRTALQIDENFMRCLEAGLPPTGGIALGLDRLFMAVHGIKNISGVRAFSIKHQIG